MQLFGPHLPAPVICDFERRHAIEPRDDFFWKRRELSPRHEKRLRHDFESHLGTYSTARKIEDPLVLIQIQLGEALSLSVGIPGETTIPDLRKRWTVLFHAPTRQLATIHHPIYVG
jgi:hypothetical protein